MYSLDINFLSDRNLTGESVAQPEKAATQSLVPSGQEPAPLIAGGIVAALCVAGAGYLYWDATQVKEQTQKDLTAITGEIQQIDAKNNSVAGLEAQIADVQSRSKAFVEVLQTKIKPWSAVLQEISDQTPSSLQLSSFQQSEGEILIEGSAQNFTDVNDFMINLQGSPLFVSEEVYIVSANLQDKLALVDFLKPTESVEVPKVVTYTISVGLRELSDAEIIVTLEQQGAKGMAERLKSSFKSVEP